MHTPDDSFDPDDNFAQAHGAGDEFDDSEATPDQLVWQLLLMLNPGDDDAALQQFTAWQERAGEDAEAMPDVDTIAEVIDWKSGFQVGDDDPGTLIDALNELTARFNLDIDWGVEDPTDDGFLATASTSRLVALAYDQLRIDGYTLWTWDTGRETVAGWIAATPDDEGMRVVANALGIDVRQGNA